MSAGDILMVLFFAGVIVVWYWLAPKMGVG
jgi:hypothetical protein